jgi:hypothetical protein
MFADLESFLKEETKILEKPRFHFMQVSTVASYREITCTDIELAFLRLRYIVIIGDLYT